MRKLTPKQARVLTVLRNFIAHKGRSPRLKELQKALKAKGIRVSSLNSIVQYLKSLEEKAYIERPLGKRQGIKLITTPIKKFEEIPLVGRADCGEALSFAEESIEDFIRVSKKFIRGKKDNYFIIRAFGDSLDKAGINDGDFVLIKKTKEINNGDIIVAVIDGCGTIKKFHHKRGKDFISLLPESKNEEHRPIFLHSGDEFAIIGKVEKVFK